MDAVGRKQAAAHRLESLPLTHQLLALPAEGSLAFFLLGGNSHDTEGLAIAPHEAVEALAQGKSIELVGLHALVALVPDLGLHHVVGHPHLGELTVEVVAERPRLIASEDIPGEALLFGHEAQEPLEAHLLDRLRSRSVDLSAHVKPLRVGVDAELDRFAGFVRIGFCFRIHRLSGWQLSPPPDNPMPSSS